MTYDFADIRRARHGLHPVAIGRPDFHVADWRGCNFHWLVLPGWPKFKYLPDTDRNRKVLGALCRAVDKTRVRLKLEGRSGSFLPDWQGIHDCKNHQTVVDLKTERRGCQLCALWEAWAHP